MVKVAFYGGVNEIGGNKILLADRNTKVLFDFGQSFDFGAKYFTGWLCPRSVNGLADHFEFGLLPKIRGLYAKEQLAFTDLPYSEPEISAVFLSHAHFDHVTHICFVDPTIPVYLGVGTKLFLESMEETSSFCDYKEHEYRTFRTGKRCMHASKRDLTRTELQIANRMRNFLAEDFYSVDSLELTVSLMHACNSSTIV
jgi:ribonuclease J